jgi:LytS/YehU family sensor histidine kinase
MEPLLGTVDGEKETPVQVLTQLKVLAGHYVMGALSGAFPFVIFYLLIERQQMIRRQTEIEKEKVVAELSALKSQLNPHFLFNTLNNIYSLALKQSKQTAPTVDKLSQILDYLLYRCNDTYVPLEKELHLLDNYLDLQKVRFGDRLVIENRYSADRSYTIAPLLLLSLVENMFKHGVEKTAGTVHLHLEIHAAAGELHFTAENPFDSVERVAGGIGLKNLSKQLDLLYPEKYSLKISQTADTFVVQLQLRLT